MVKKKHALSPSLHNRLFHWGVKIQNYGGHGGLVVKAADSRARGWGFKPHSGRRVVSLSKAHLLPKSTGNTQEAVAPS